MKTKTTIRIVSMILASVLASASVAVAAYTPASTQINNSQQLVKLYLDSGMSKDKVLEQFDEETSISIELTVRSNYESEVNDFVKKNVKSSKEFTLNPDSPNLSTGTIMVTTAVLKEIMNKEWYVSYEYVLSDIRTVEEIKKDVVDEYHNSVNSVEGDTIKIAVEWNDEMNEEEIRKHLSSNAEIVDFLNYEKGSKFTSISIPKSESEYYVDLYEDEKKEYAVKRISCVVNDETVPTINDIYRLGDIDSDDIIDVSDLTELSHALIGDKELTAEQKKAADVDEDGAVTLADLARLQQYLSKKIDKL